MSNDDEKTMKFNIKPETQNLVVTDSDGNQLSMSEKDAALYCADTDDFVSEKSAAGQAMKDDDALKANMVSSLAAAGLTQQELRPTLMDKAAGVLRAVGVISSPPRTIEREADLGQMPSPLQSACNKAHATSQQASLDELSPQERERFNQMKADLQTQSRGMTTDRSPSR